MEPTTLLLRIATYMTGTVASFEEVLDSVMTLMQAQGLEMLTAILRTMDRALLAAWRAGTLVPPVCCGHPAWEVEGTTARTIRTSLGNAYFRWHRLRCRRCKARWVPLRTALQVEAYQRHSAELERQGLELVAQASYRQAERTFRARQVQVARSTLHEWVRQTTSTALPAPEEPDRVLLSDGMVTRGQPDVRRQPSEPRTPIDRDLRIAVGITPTGETVIRGAWSGPSWQAIGEDVATLEGAPVVGFVHDGEPGLGEGFAPTAHYLQRCHRHLTTKIDKALMADDVPQRARQCWQAALIHILAIELPATETSTPTQRRTVRQTLELTTQLLASLIGELAVQGASHGASYLRRAFSQLMSYVEAWWHTGKHIPRTTAVIESVMSEIAPRLKGIGRQWKGPGLVQVAKIILLMRNHQEHWDAYWHRRMHRSGAFTLTYTVCEPA